MGQAIARCALANPAFEIGSALEAPHHKALGRNIGIGVRPIASISEAFRRGQVIVEFTEPRATMQHVLVATVFKKPMVIGTTGLSHSQQAKLREASRQMAIVFSPNMSVGVNLLFELAQLAAQRLGPGYDVEVVEAHHRQKYDAPSGTAKRLADVLAAARQQPVSAIPVHAIRAGDIVGDHTVVLAGPSERLELTHRAHSREVFAQGALRAAQFVVTQQPGLYEMSDVLKHSP